MAGPLTIHPNASLLTVSETAKFLRIGQRTLEGMIAIGRFPVIRMSRGLIRIDPQDIVTFIQSHKDSNFGANHNG